MTDDPQALRPAIGRPPTSLFERDDPATASRLPRIGTAEEADAPAADASASESPLRRFAAEVEVPDGVPRMAFVLLDDGSGPLGPEALETFPFPVSFAIAPGHPDPALAARGYRENGFEVLAVGDLPEGATAADVEVILTGLLDALPEAVAVIEAPGASLQSSREVAAQTTAFLAASGHGLLMQSKGLNTAQQLALQSGVPSASLFRDIDAEGQDQALIRRTLDQAAFRARQDASVVLLGRLRADTISALLLWGLQDRSSEIALVPASTVLIETLDPETE